MLPRKIQLEDITSVAAGKAAIINLPIGPRYRDVTLVTGNTAAGDANAPTVAGFFSATDPISMHLGGEQRRVLASHLDVINTAMGAEFASQAYAGGGNGLGRRHVRIFFREPWRNRIRQNSIDTDALGWKTRWLGKNGVFRIRVPIVAGITPFLSAWATVDDHPDDTPSPIMKWYSGDYNPNGNVTTLDRKDLYSMLSIFDTSDAKTVESVRLTAGPVELHNLSKNENTTNLKGIGMNPAAGAYHVVFDEDDSLDGAFAAAGQNDLILRTTLSAASAGTFSIVSQRYGRPD